ncbi:MAG: valine--tRNA ligase [Candidatus Binataceae bacterium]
MSHGTATKERGRYVVEKTFDSKAAEERWFQRWIELGYFRADPGRPGMVFSIVIPPPNVTGALHLGSAFNNVLQDIVVRTRRMQGYNTLWVPGTDHAGIATQNVVEREIAREGKSRHELGRAGFVERVWEWRTQYGGRILYQLRRLGASCDWSRERFTLDEGLSRAVLTVFERLYREGLIYRDRRLINWCPRCETALSDLEVDHKDTDGHLYYIRYPFADGSGAVIVATTRPETMLGDTAVAVHPEDQRYTAIVGRTLKLPLVGREIGVIADSAVDPNFGTGAVKITPAHDFNDFDLARRHNLAQLSVMDTRGRMNEAAGPYQGLSREECRRRVLDELKTQGLLEEVKPHRHALGICSRCYTAVEPMLSMQWFVRVRPLADKAIAAVRDGRTRFFPKFWENTYFNWMENIHDWCISRQLWWGHRIPAYTCHRCNHVTVAVERPLKCEHCKGTDLAQDEDVLDTWFSSALWPFSTLGWPERTPELEKYYPTSLLVTGFDIIFFWVARMMMMGLFFTGEAPFRDIYITPLVRDKYGQKMTKSKGNVVDPLEVMERYGTDALRFTFAQLAVQGRDLLLSDERLAASRAFANKIWNAARFVMLNLEGAAQPLPAVETPKLGLAERWILTRLDNTVGAVTAAIDAYEFNSAALAVYQFVWHEFCDWYIELSKEPLKAGGEDREAARYVLVRCFDGMLRILHPFMPFISEELWQSIRPYIPEPGLSEHIVVAKFPAPSQGKFLTAAEEAAMNHCIEATEAINSLRSLLGYHPGERVKAHMRRSQLQLGLQEFPAWRSYAMTLCKAASFQYDQAAGSGQYDEAAGGGRSVVFSPLSWGEVGIEPPPGFDFSKAREKLQRQLEDVSRLAAQHQHRLSDPGFQAKADEDTKAESAQKWAQLEERKVRLQEQIRQLASQAGP